MTRSQKQWEWFTDIIKDVEDADTKGLVENHIFVTQFFDKFDLRTTMLVSIYLRILAYLPYPFRPVHLREALPEAVRTQSLHRIARHNPLWPSGLQPVLRQPPGRVRLTSADRRVLLWSTRDDKRRGSRLRRH